ncbi:MAG TPA: OmpH family outer membrane protein [Fimbriimonas sp.]|nr:OmpH family outer membrane protein [Fimbriimonas sp.]
MNTQKAGWIAAAVLAGGIVTVGFNQATKTGIVDVEKVFNESTLAKNQSESLRAMGTARQSVLEFLQTYQHMKPEDATKFKELTIKTAALTAPEKAELERIKNESQAAETKYRELVTKTPPTPEELKQVEDFNRRKDAVGDLFQQWNAEFRQEVDAKNASLRADVLGKVRIAIAKVGREQGYSVIFDANVAPYAANDVTEDALKAVNAMK